jgi:hypothetical protein
MNVLDHGDVLQQALQVPAKHAYLRTCWHKRTPLLDGCSFFHKNMLDRTCFPIVRVDAESMVEDQLDLLPITAGH